MKGGARLVRPGLAAVLLLAVFGEGGAHPTALLAWHGLLAATIGVALWSPGPPTGLAPRLRLPLAAFSALALVGPAFAGHRYGAWESALEVAAAIAVLCLAARSGPEFWRMASLPLLVVAAAESAWLLVQVAQGVSRPAGTFLNPNHLGGWIAAVLLADLAPALARERVPGLESRGAERWIRVAALSLAACGLAVTRSRGAWLALVCGGAAAAAVVLWSRVPPGARRRRRAAALVAVALLAAGLGAWVLHRLRTPDPFPYHRVAIWRAASQVALERPWLGTGPGQFGIAARAHRFPDGDGPLRYDRVFTTTHSDALRVPAELGFPAALVLIWAAAAALPVAREALRERRPHALGVLAALVGLAAQAVVENLSVRPAVYLLGAALAGTLLSQPRAAPRLSVPARGAASLVLALLFLAGDAAPWRAWNLARGLPHEGALAAAEVRSLERAIALNPLHPAYRSRLATHLAADLGGEGAARYAEARELAERAVALNPRDAVAWRDLARVEVAGCRELFPDVACRERAGRLFREAERRSPFDPFLPIERAGFLLDTGDPFGARRAAERALGLEPEAVLPRLLLADASLEDGTATGRERARRLLDEAVDKARAWSGARGESRYAESLLHLDPQVYGRLRERLDGGAADPAARPVAAHHPPRAPVYHGGPRAACARRGDPTWRES